ncbi:uncharacterized protein LOC121295093 [Polyodon spathula]|uniref:uncharacterized protein LOC121295093 n=1 Tax=Polyodon spathula TaxID=7913 RepID=UPI001B7F34EE|nr:uncharacterized protein LOC121295093 [Polyodon spathula]
MCFLALGSGGVFNFIFLGDMEPGRVVRLLLFLTLSFLWDNSQALDPASDFSYLGSSFSLEPSGRENSTEVLLLYRVLSASPCPAASKGLCGVLNCTTPSQQGAHGSSPSPGWCQAQGEVIVHVEHSSTLQLSSSGCCWSQSVAPRLQFVLLMRVELGFRSDTGSPNSPPQAALLPPVRLPRNCATSFSLGVLDREGDVVRCRYGQRARAECTLCSHQAFLHVDEELCVLWYTGGGAQGTYAVELIVEDYPRAAVTLTHTQGTRTIPPYSSTGTPLSSTPLHFTVTVEGESPECMPGLARPGFTQPTPANGETVSVLPYDEVTFTISAVSSDMVSDIVVLGPPGLVLSNLWEEKTAGVRVVSANVSWTGTSRQDPRSKPVCFSASTNRFQSEPRCIWIAQQTTIEPPPGTVLQCLEERMKLFLPRIALPDINESDLQLIDPTCNITGNSTHFLLDIPLTDCGTRIQEEDSYLVLVNVVSSRLLSQDLGAVITRIPSLRFPLACRFKAGGLVTGMVSIPQRPKDEAFGKFTFDIKFRRELPAVAGVGRIGDMGKMDTPFELDPIKPLYLQVNASCNITGVELVVQSCWTAESKNTTRSGSSSFINNGCGSSGNVELMMDELNDKIYKINLTSLIPARIVPEVYIHCSVKLCMTMSDTDPCSPNCSSSRSFSSKSYSRSAFLLQSLESSLFTVSAGPIRLGVNSTITDTVNPLSPSSLPSVPTSSSEIPNRVGIAVGVVLGAAVLLIVGLLLIKTFLGIQNRRKLGHYRLQE